jgi:hypothetical protein
MSDAVKTEWFGHQLAAVDLEIARQATICEVKILDPGVIDAVLRNDPSVCGARNPVSFGKLRDLVMIHYAVLEKTIEQLGPDETRVVRDTILARLRTRFGGSDGDVRSDGPTVS